MNPLIEIKKITLSGPTETDKRADEQRIADALGLSRLEIPLRVLRKLPVNTGEELPCIIGLTGESRRLIDIGTDSSCSVALDLGTTNIVAALYDNVTGRVLSEVKVENPQIDFGSDILTRMQYTMLGRAGEVNGYLMDGVDSVIKKLCDREGVEERNIHALVAAGNTVMSHYFLGLDVSRIPVDPYTPVVRSPGFFRAADLSLKINPEALVYVFPNAGSYVGGDIISGILASGIADSEETAVLIDVGTNAEIVVGNRDWLLVGAGAAGPALEEGIASIGRRAEDGIVYDVDISETGISCMTFNNLPAEGICGSGMVSLIYELYCSGIIGNDGVLNSEHKEVNMVDGESLFVLPCASGTGLEIKQTEIDNFLSSKAAMFTLLLVMLRSVGLGFGDIGRVYVAGALGNGINAEKAAGIGMLPAWPSGNIVPLGNASLKGALMLLENFTPPEHEEGFAGRITYRHMHDDPEFMKEFRGARFIPHTDPSLLEVKKG